MPPQDAITYTLATPFRYMRIPRMAVASIPDQAWHGGYNFTFIKPVPDRICCSICTKVLHDPHLTGCCGQYFCESCLEHRFKKQKTACPHCRHKDFNHILDKALKREIDEIEIQCTKQGLGCQWVGELGTLQTHLDSDKGCGYLEVQCSNKCGAKMMRKELKAHLERKCSLRNIQCHFEDTYQTITSKHYGECPHYPLPCPNKCGTTGIRRADMDSRCELESVECPFREAGCKVHVMRKEFDSHMSGNQQNHLLMLLGAYQETKRKLDENRREMDENHRELDENRRELDENRRELNESRTKLHYTRLRLMELEESQYNQMTLKNIGDRVTFRMYDYSLYKHTSRVWLSPPFYLGDGYKLCLAVYANGRGAGAGTHVSVELLQMKGEHDDKLRWGGGSIPTYLSIRMMAQRFKAQHRKNSFLLEGHICSGCLTRLPAHKNFRVFMSEGRSEVSESKFIDHQTAEQLMVLNDTIALNIGYHIESSAYGSD